MFTIKLSKQRCLECSTCAIFLSSSLTVSMIALLRNNNLSETLNFQDRSAIISSPPSSSERSGEGEGGDEMR